MAKNSAATSGGFVGELFQTGLYKRTQGRVSRQVTFAAIAICVAMAAWRMAETTPFGYDKLFGGAKYLFSGLLLAVGCWLAYRLVNMPKFADFLIAVEAEMNKVSWPSRAELVRSSMVVIFVIFVMAALLFSYDMIWLKLFSWFGLRI
jgi:preprotein translocase subunit SecE